MTDEQFKQLMEKLEQIEREITAGRWKPLFNPPPIYQPPSRPWDGLPPDWGMPRITD